MVFQSDSVVLQSSFCSSTLITAFDDLDLFCDFLLMHFSQSMTVTMAAWAQSLLVMFLVLSMSAVSQVQGMDTPIRWCWRPPCHPGQSIGHSVDSVQATESQSVKASAMATAAGFYGAETMTTPTDATLYPCKAPPCHRPCTRPPPFCHYDDSFNSRFRGSHFWPSVTRPGAKTTSPDYVTYLDDSHVNGWVSPENTQGPGGSRQWPPRKNTEGPGGAKQWPPRKNTEGPGGSRQWPPRMISN